MTNSDRIPEIKRSRQFNATAAPLNKEILAKYITQGFQSATFSWTADFLVKALTLEHLQAIMPMIGITAE